MFSKHLFHKQVLGLLLIFPGELFLGGMEPWPQFVYDEFIV